MEKTDKVREPENVSPTGSSGSGREGMGGGGESWRLTAGRALKLSEISAYRFGKFIQNGMVWSRTAIPMGKKKLIF